MDAFYFAHFKKVLRDRYVDMYTYSYIRYMYTYLYACMPPLLIPLVTNQMTLHYYRE